MRPIHAGTAYCGSALALLGSVVSAQGRSEAGAEQNRVVVLPAGYRDWRLISIAHEADPLNDIRAVLGNKLAVDAFRSGARPFPDGAIIVRLAYRYVPSDQNNAIFGQQQSFVAGAPTNVQVSVKDARRFAATGGWSYGQFKDGTPDPGSQPVETCFACHNSLGPARDLVFTNYAP